MKNVFCPNINDAQVNRDFSILKEKVGENLAYYYWNISGGQGLEQALAAAGMTLNSKIGEPVEGVFQRNYLNDIDNLPDIPQAFEVEGKSKMADVQNDNSAGKAFSKGQFLLFAKQYQTRNKYAQIIQNSRKGLISTATSFSATVKDDVPQALKLTYSTEQSAREAMSELGIDLVAYANPIPNIGKFQIRFKSVRVLNRIYDTLYKLFRLAPKTTKETAEIKQWYFNDSDETTADKIAANIIRRYHGNMLARIGFTTQQGKNHVILAGYLSKRCGDFLKSIKVVYTDDQSFFTGANGNIASGIYRVNTNTIYINKLSPVRTWNGHIEQELLHEICHAVTAQFLRNQQNTELYQQAVSLYDSLIKQKLTSLGVRSLLHANDLLNATLKEQIDFLVSYEDISGFRPYYWMSNLDEFFSEFWSNPMFKMQLENTPYDVNTSFLQKIRQFFINLFGKMDMFKGLSNNAYTEALRIFDSIIDYNNDYIETYDYYFDQLFYDENVDLPFNGSPELIEETQKRLSQKIENASKTFLEFTNLGKNKKGNLARALNIIENQILLPIKDVDASTPLEQIYDSIDFSLNDYQNSLRRKLESLQKDRDSLRFNTAGKYYLLKDFLDRYTFDTRNEVLQLYSEEQQRLIKQHYSNLFNDDLKKWKWAVHKHKQNLKQPTQDDYARDSQIRMGIDSRIKKVKRLFDFTKVVSNYREIIKKFSYNLIKNAAHTVIKLEFVKPDKPITLKQILSGFSANFRYEKREDFKNVILYEAPASQVLSQLKDVMSKNPAYKYLVKYIKNNDVKVKFAQSQNQSTEGTKGCYDVIENEVTIYVNYFNGADNEYGIHDFMHTIAHELIHALTSRTILDDTQSYRKMEAYVEYLRRNYKDVFELRYGPGIAYGLNNPQEFIAEFFSNVQFQNMLKEIPAVEESKFKSAFHEFLNKILEFLGIKPATNAYEQMFPVMEEIVDASCDINNIDIDELAQKWEQTEEYKDLKVYRRINVKTQTLQDKAVDISKKLNTTLEARIKSIEHRSGSRKLATKIQQQIQKYEDLLQASDDVAVICDFIKDTNELFTQTLINLNRAKADPSLVSDTNLNALKSEIIDFYKPFITEINKTLITQGYLEADGRFSEDELETIKTQISKASNKADEIEGAYEDLLKNRVISILIDTCSKYGYDPQEVEDYINDNLNSTTKDIGFLRRWLQPMRSSKDLISQITAKLMIDINNNVKRKTSNMMQDTLRVFSQVKQSQVELLFERDKNGKLTGNLIRDLNYGQFYADYREFLEDLNQRYGVDNNTYNMLSQEDYDKYIAEKEAWLNKHCNRRYVDAFYTAFNKLPKLAQQRSNIITAEINDIIQQATDENGNFNIMKLTTAQYKKLDQLFVQRKNLSNIYNYDGSLKTGEDLDVAEALQKYNEELAEIANSTQDDVDDSDVREAIREHREKLSDKEFADWFNRNIVTTFKPEFYDFFKTHSKDLGSDQVRYEELQSERRELLRLGQHMNSNITDIDLLHPEVRKRIREIDIEMREISMAHHIPGQSSGLSEFIDFRVTPQYIRDKAYYESQGDEVYGRWVRENHDSKGNPYSYYTYMQPAENYYQDMVIYRFTPVNREAAKTSRLVNPNYDFSQSGEKYQPKRELYDNTAAYKAATATQEQKNVYDYTLDILKQSNAKISFLRGDRSYVLPQITGSICDRLFRSGNFLGGLASVFADPFIVRDDNEQYATKNQNQNPDGSPLLFVPTHYMDRLDDPTMISHNLQKMLVLYYKMAENYKQKQDKKATFKLLESLLSQREHYGHNMVTGNYIEKGPQTNIYQKYSNFLRMQLYGQMSKAQAVRVGNSKYYVAWNKLFAAIRSYATSANLANNIPAIVKALFQGTHKSFIEGCANRYFSLTNYVSALFREIVRLPEMLFNLGNTRHNNTTLALLETMQIATDFDTKLMSANRNRFVRIFNRYLLWGGWSAVDYFVKAPIMRAMLADYKYIPEFNQIMSSRAYVRKKSNKSNSQADYKKYRRQFNGIKSFTLNDVFKSVDGKLTVKPQYEKYVVNGVINTALMNGVTNAVRVIANRIDGVLADEDKTDLMTNCFGALLFMHRSFFIANLDDNFLLQQQYNPALDDMVEAKYTSAWKGLMGPLMDFAINIYRTATGKEKKAHEKLKDFQIYNIKRTLIQCALWIFYGYLSSSIIIDQFRDYSQPYMKQLAGYAFSGMAFEEKAEYMPFDFFNQIKSPSAAIAPVENLTNLYKLIAPTYWDYAYNEYVVRGPYKGKTNAEKLFIRSVPGLRGLYESGDIVTKWNYLNTNLKK